MKYIAISFFDKYQISTETPSAKLMVAFQTDPSKRKDLPLVISTLKSQEKLFEEELFSINYADTPRTNVLKQLKSKELNDSFITGFLSTFKLVNNSLENELFHQSINISSDKKASILQSFKSCLFNEFINFITSDLDKFSASSISILLDSISEINEDYFDSFEEIISEKIELSFSKSENKDALKANLDLVSNLPKSFINRPTVYRSFLYFVQKGFLSNDNFELKNEYFRPIFKLLNHKDAAAECDALIKIAHDLFDLEGTKKIAFETLKHHGEILARNYVYYLQNIKNDGVKFDEDEFELCIRIIGVFANQSQVWYKAYFEKLNRVRRNNTSENIYDLIEHIVNAGFPKDLYKVLSTVLIKATGFDVEIARWADKNEKLNGAVEALKKSPTLIRYDDIMAVPNFKNFINSPADVDELLCKFYCFHYLNPEIFPNNAVENIKASAFALLGFLDCGNFMMSANSGVGNLNYKGLFIRDVLTRCPADWEVGGKTVSSFLRDLGYGYRSSYGNSKFSSYKTKYDTLFRNASNKIKTTQCDLIIRTGKEASNKYLNAIEQFKKHNYVRALELFKEIPDYKDSEEYISKCDELIKKEAYKNAQALADEKRYKEASDAFNSISGYKDADKKAKEYRVCYCITVYQTAQQDFSSKNYEKALKELEEIKAEYPDAGVLYNECLNEYNQSRYEKAVDLFNAKQFEKALTVFMTIQSYSEAQKYILECKKAIEEIKNSNDYKQAEKYVADYYSSKKLENLEKALNIYSILAKKSYKDSAEKEKEIRNLIFAIKEKARKAKRNKIIIVVAIILAIITAVAIIVPVSVNKHRQNIYQDLISYVERTNGNTYKNEIESILSELPDHYADSDSYEIEYYYKRVKYLVNNYQSSYRWEIDSLFRKIPSNYKDIAQVKKDYEDAQYLPTYNKLIDVMKAYNGSSSTDSSINNYLNQLPSDYKDVSTIETQFKNIKSYISTISSVSYYESSMTDSKGNTVRKALKNIMSIDYGSSNWNCSKYYSTLDVRKVVYGAEFTYSSYSFKWYDNPSGSGQRLSWDIPSDKSSTKSYYFGTRYSSSKLYFYLENQNNSSDTLDVFNVSNVQMSGSKIAVSVYINKLATSYMFTVVE